MPELYLLCFDRPYKHARHYLGFSYTTARRRLGRHLMGRGSRLLKYVIEAGINFRIVRTWQGKAEDLRKLERSYKVSGHLKALCPRCKRRKSNMNETQREALGMIEHGWEPVKYTCTPTGKVGTRYALFVTLQMINDNNVTMTQTYRIGSFEGPEEFMLEIEKALNTSLKLGPLALIDKPLFEEGPVRTASLTNKCIKCGRLMENETELLCEATCKGQGPVLVYQDIPERSITLRLAKLIPPNNKMVKIGDDVTWFVNKKSDHVIEVCDIEEPHKPESTGRVYVKRKGDPNTTSIPFDPSVIKAVWINRKDRD